MNSTVTQVELSERSTPPLFGRQARTYRRNRIHELIRIVVGNNGWRKAFLTEFPHFDNSEGVYLLGRATNGQTDDHVLLQALEVWIPQIQKEQPDWFVKQIPVNL